MCDYANFVNFQFCESYREIVRQPALQLHIDEKCVEPKMKDFFTAPREFHFGISPQLFSEFLFGVELEFDIFGKE